VIHGGLLLDKPLGISSNAALQAAKKIYGARKAGHAGTLDPLATGLLVVLFGEATKLAGLLLDQEKEYLASVKLGETTSTGDAEGEILESKAVAIDTESLRGVLGRFLGEIEQVPPMHSALKRGGVPLYRLARQGRTWKGSLAGCASRASSWWPSSRPAPSCESAAAREPTSGPSRKTSARPSVPGHTSKPCVAPRPAAFASTTRSSCKPCATSGLPSDPDA
jgi:hypothetical protein